MRKYPQLSDEFVHRVLVDDRLVLDLLGAVGVAKRRQRLVVVDVGRRQRRDHHRLTVTWVNTTVINIRRSSWSPAVATDIC